MNIDNMEERYIKITNTAYSALDFFPEADPLKNRAKEKVLSIMESLVLISGIKDQVVVEKRLAEDIDILLSYLNIAKLQNWISSMNYLIISNEYENIRKELIKIKITEKLPSEKEVVIKKVVTETKPEVKQQDILLSERQKKIIDFLKEKGKAQVMDLQTVLGNITKRTIRRDLDELLKSGKIVRTGEWNQVSYTIADSDRTVMLS